MNIIAPQCTHNVKDLSGQRRGKLVINRLVGMKVYRRGRVSIYECSCDCGATVERSRQILTTKPHLSCGCDHRVAGTTGAGDTRHPLFRTWDAMVQRCHYPTSTSYQGYGARGIAVCERWLNGEGGQSGFVCFAGDMTDGFGPGLSIGRIDNDGPYSPANCRWETPLQQARNKSNSRMLEHNGKVQCIAAWAEETGLKASCIRSRVKLGWAVPDTLSVATGLHRSRAA
jgi:hypothetical protein